MKAGGKDWQHIAKVFGLKSHEDVLRRIALGSIPKIETIDTGINIKEAFRYLLPLRLEVGRSDEDGRERIYDYSEIENCIEKLTSGELDRDSLPNYVTGRRLAILEALLNNQIHPGLNW